MSTSQWLRDYAASWNRVKQAVDKAIGKNNGSVKGERLAQHMLSQSTQSLSLQSMQSAGSMDGHCEAGSVDMASSGA